MNFFYNYSPYRHKDHSVSKRILTDAVCGGLGLVPLILATTHHKINPDSECIDAEKVKSLTMALESDRQRSRQFCDINLYRH